MAQLRAIDEHGLSHLRNGSEIVLLASRILGFNGTVMEQIGNVNAPRRWMASVLTDIHFWVPMAVLIGGLALLRFIH
jgi:hypothetical protein